MKRKKKKARNGKKEKKIRCPLAIRTQGEMKVKNWKEALGMRLES